MTAEESAVPLYEYVCTQCSHQFEELVFGSTKPSCPRCSATELRRLLSVVSVAVKDGPASAPRDAGPCGSCEGAGPGGCRYAG